MTRAAPPTGGGVVRAGPHIDPDTFARAIARPLPFTPHDAPCLNAPVVVDGLDAQHVVVGQRVPGVGHQGVVVLATHNQVADPSLGLVS